VRLQAHLERNPKDQHNKHSLHLVESKIRRLVRYYKSEGKIPQDFVYSIETAKLLVE